MNDRLGSFRTPAPISHAGSPRPRAARQAVVAGLVLAVALGACSATQPSAPPGSTPTDFGTPPSGDSSPGASDSGNAIVIDPTLLLVLPAKVGGLVVDESPEGDQSAETEPALAKLATAAVGAVAVDASSTDLAYALVVKLRPGALTDGKFRDWRDSYDEGACGGASAIVGHAETPIAGRNVFIGTCSGGLRTYHLWIKDKDLLISVSSLGPRKLGELLLADLRP
jgi:hypothetical protein